MLVLLVYNKTRVSISDEFAWGNRVIFVENSRNYSKIKCIGV